jgi:hypothetical protein
MMTQDEMANLLFADRVERVIVHDVIPFSVYDDSFESRGFFPVPDVQYPMAPPAGGQGYCPNCGGGEYYDLPVFAGRELIDHYLECLECGY